jgi:type III pantothenate kinase
VNLILDIGNTRVKAALFEQYRLVQLNTYPDFKSFILDEDFYSKAKKGILASVVEDIGEEISFLQKRIPLIIFSPELSLPLKNKYLTPQTLGADRILASVGAQQLYPNKNVLVIDAGTCVKYNFTNQNNEFIGGAISPGIDMRFKALNQFTSKLPYVPQKDWDYPLIGQNTIQSISSGVIHGVIAEINGIIEEYKRLYPGLICVLTGGDSDFLAIQLKNPIFVRPNLVLEGLNHILIQQLETN